MLKKSQMLDIFNQSGFLLSPRQADQFIIYYDLIVKHNESLDLTRLKSFEDIVVKHFIDSIYITKYLDLPSPLIDIGTGAGFPGIPLKILLPDITLILAEPRKKRALFLETAVRTLELSDVTVYPHMVTDKSFFTVGGVITRALEPIDDTLTRVRHFLSREGRVVLMKGPEADEDLKAVSEENYHSYSLESDREYSLPGTNYSRRIIVYQKISAATRKTYSILKDLSATAGIAITSGQNKKFKNLEKLSSTDGIRKAGTALVSGKKIIKEIIRKGSPPVTELVLYDGYAEHDDVLNAVIGEFELRGSLIVLKKSLFNRLDLFKTRNPLAVVETPEIKEWDRTLGPGCTLLIPFQDPANVGSAIRSAAGFNVRKIIILKQGANPYHPKSIRASAGAVFSVDIMNGPSLYDLGEALKEKASSIIALDAGGEPLPSFDFPERFLLLPGIEGPGLPQELKARSVAVPLAAGVESLNAAAALSIALYEWNRRYSPSN
ncbi:MAG: 16S rRNA (guanine(527)-N(7))-methyltransferase RsmG [Spirochaetes bacterium RBG_16_49_21]|nr:MAG: 16S rRNA (guanine(527)-N(7))-methyltransferase RsmG [Spirochaetes bacterium RBG_16_49_21]